MEEIQTKTTRISTKTEQTGNTNGKDWTRYVFQFEDFKGSTFDADLANEFKSGDTVKVTFKKSGVYNNIVDLEKVETKKESEFQTADQVPQSVWLEKDKRIVRQNCNERAIELMELIFKVDPEYLKTLIKESGDILSVVDIFSEHFEQRVFRDYN